MADPAELTETEIVARLRASGSVLAEQEARLILEQAEDAEDVLAMVEWREAGYPLEPVSGNASFYGLQIDVDPGVFVPRRRTEHLVALAVALARPGAVVVDLCCGSGAIGLAILTEVGDIDLHASDLDPAAVTCAEGNLRGFGHVYEGDLYDPLPPALRGRIDLLVANAPHLPTGAPDLLPAEAQQHEASLALDGGTDGLDVQRRVVAGAITWLAPGGHLLIETSVEQAPATAALFVRAGFSADVVTSDDLEATVVIGTWADR